MTGHHKVMPPRYELVRIRELTMVISTTAGSYLSDHLSYQACSECNFTVSVVPREPTGASHVGGTNKHPFCMAQPPVTAFEATSPLEGDYIQ